MTIGIAKDSLEERSNSEYEYVGGRKRSAKTTLEGKFILTIEGLVENGIFDQYVATQKKSSIALHINLVRGIAIYASRELNCRGTVTTSGFTSCKLNIGEREEIFRCTSKFAQDGEWYDWCLIEWEITPGVVDTYPALILGFIEMGGKELVVIQSSNNPMTIEMMTEEFICKFTMDPNTPTSVVEIQSISNPLCVFKNYGGSKSEYFCASPQRYWSRFFGDRIRRT